MKRTGKEEIAAVSKVLKSEEFSSFYRKPYGGSWVQKFEQAFANYIGVKHAISVCNGTAALHTAYLASLIRKGDEVITTPLTFVSTATMLLACGAKVIFADVDPKTYNINPEAVNELITKNTKAIVPVHLIGQCCQMDALQDLAKDHHLLLIEDACQALGGKFKGKNVGTFGDLAVFSFQETKQITTLGEGGMIVTNNDVLAERCRKIRNNAAKYFGDTDFLGFNYRLTNVQAAFGLAQLSKLDMFIEKEVENAKYAIERLPKALTPPYVAPNVKHTYYIVGCLFNDNEAAEISRDEFLKRINEKGLNKLRPGKTIGGGYSEVIYHLPYFQKHKKLWRGKCPNAEKLPKKWVWFDYNRFPSTTEDMDRMLQGFEQCLKKGN